MRGESLAFALLGGGLVAVCVAAASWIGRWHRRWSTRAIARRAVEGEHEAEQLLRQAGFSVCGRQVCVPWAAQLDGEDVATPLRVDLLAERAGVTYVAEVKTGSSAPLLTNAATRRQLLEYQLATGADGVLLIDADRGSVHEVAFDLPVRSGDDRMPPRRGFALGFVVGIGTAVAISALLLPAFAG